LANELQTNEPTCPPALCRSGHDGTVSPRFFLCARCRTQALICGCCDRGHIYCSGICSRQSRRERQSEAARRSRTRPEAKRKRTLRNQRLRERRKSETHQGPAAVAALAVLPPDITKGSKNGAPKSAPLHRPVPRCQWCGCVCGLAFRQGFIQRRDRRRARAGHNRKEIAAHGYAA
jgi:hypothetical protein